MGMYAITGGSKGIGEKTVEILKDQGHEVICIARENADINADIGTKEGRKLIIDKVHEICSDGLDGLICNAGVALLPKYESSYVVSVNYFGTVAIAEGLHDLLKMKSGNCTITVSGSLAYPLNGKYFIDGLLNNCGDEERICRLVNSLDRNVIGMALYVSTKIALARWVRRVSASWAAGGVTINALAPGPVDTTIMGVKMVPNNENTGFFQPLPVLNGKNRVIDPIEVAHTLAFLVSPGAKCINGSIVFCDAGTEAVLNTEKFY